MDEPVHEPGRGKSACSMGSREQIRAQTAFESSDFNKIDQMTSTCFCSVIVWEDGQSELHDDLTGSYDSYTRYVNISLPFPFHILEALIELSLISLTPLNKLFINKTLHYTELNKLILK